MAEHNLTFVDLRLKVYLFIKENYKRLLMFMGLNFLFLAVLFFCLGGVRSLWFLVWGLGYYLFHFSFFRWCFKRKPYLLTIKFFNTLYPAFKVLFMVMLGLTLLAYLPYFPLLFGGTSETLKKAITLFIGDFMGDSNAYNFIISLILLFLLPIIFYRPLLGWVATIIGRSGYLKNIFKHTSGYYFLFLKILFIFYLLVICFLLFGDLCLTRRLWFCLGGTPLIVLFDLFVAKTYESLFLD